MPKFITILICKMTNNKDFKMHKATHKICKSNEEPIFLYTLKKKYNNNI